MKFGEILKEIRKENKDSLRKLSEKSNIGHSYIDRIERGQLEPSENVLKGLFKAYPTYKRKLSKAFIKEKIPAFVFNEIVKDNIIENTIIKKETNCISFGKILKEVRLNNGDSIRGLGEKINVVFSFIDKVEKGIAQPSEKLYDGVIKVYPLYRRKFTLEYVKTKLPQSALDELNINDISEDSLDRILILLELLEKDEKKLILNNIVEKVELKAYQNGTLETLKNLLDEIKEKIEEL